MTRQLCGIMRAICTQGWERFRVRLTISSSHGTAHEWTQQQHCFWNLTHVEGEMHSIPMQPQHRQGAPNLQQVSICRLRARGENSVMCTRTEGEISHVPANTAFARAADALGTVSVQRRATAAARVADGEIVFVDGVVRKEGLRGHVHDHGRHRESPSRHLEATSTCTSIFWCTRPHIITSHAQRYQKKTGDQPKFNGFRQHGTHTNDISRGCGM